MAKEKTKMCAFVTGSSEALLKDRKRLGVPDRCREKGCLGVFKIDEDPNCGFFIDREESLAKARIKRKEFRKAESNKKE